MTFSNLGQPKRVQNVIVLPHNSHSTGNPPLPIQTPPVVSSVKLPNPTLGPNSGVLALSLPNTLSFDDKSSTDKSRTLSVVPTSRVLAISSSNEYLYYMKTNMIARILNNTRCGMCPK